MANNCCVRGILCARIEQRFQSSRWTFEEERSDGGSLGHSQQITGSQT